MHVSQIEGCVVEQRVEKKRNVSDVLVQYEIVIVVENRMDREN